MSFYGLLADAVVLFHGLFVLFAVLGGLLLARWPRLIWLHLPAIAWAVGITVTGGICPLTPLENDLRWRAGQEGYEGGFIAHYVWSLLYPEGLTRPVQAGLGLAAMSLNLFVYARWWRRRRALQAAG
ncbi:hypothetical protein CEK29_09025 [Bordetella genomosp. 5]|uniref:DUF2784 domain-containing protein n=1 Tax=Bordetella genomosp. 5 TaxID=1395608 RepID=A0A261TXM7_9BORD|nr:DUF2784 domain-containing protein [Bordetella genomosp. 5]OZI44820.1 hypothetical protein CEK29_09025 [Bordetella genomosp. 5]OZI53750.1 hypothetical protein CAL25_07260 [Bordetella genomosp. 5]